MNLKIRFNVVTVLHGMSMLDEESGEWEGDGGEGGYILTPKYQTLPDSMFSA